MVNTWLFFYDILMLKLLLSIFFFAIYLFYVFPHNAHAAYSNYNSVMVGDRAAGMGGAFTAMTGDPAGIIYYNPANLSLMKGNSLSAAVSVYHKYDSSFGDQDSFEDSTKRINQGSFKSIPASSGSILSFGHFAFGLSILVPDYNFYQGEVNNQNDNISTFQKLDQSLWVGVGFGKNWTEDTSWGFSVYYTALDAQINTRDQSSLNSGTDTKQIVDERSITNNSLLYIAGITHKLNDSWKIAASYRFNPIEISGKGSYYSSSIDTTGSNDGATQLFEKSVDTDQAIPTRLALGVSYESASKSVFSFDLVSYGAANFQDFQDKDYSRNYKYVNIVNVHLGYEYFVNPQVKIRTGLYSNLSSHQEVDEDTSYWQPEHIDMWGFSANAAVFTSDKASFTFGGYYTGGTGYAKHLIENSYQKVEAKRNIFSMLISSAYYF